MGTIVTIIGWLIAAACLAAAASSLIRTVRFRGRRLRPARDGVSAWTPVLLWACAGIAALTGLGALALLPGIVLSALLGAGAVLAVRSSSGGLMVHLGSGFAYARSD